MHGARARLGCGARRHRRGLNAGLERRGSAAEGDAIRGQEAADWVPLHLWKARSTHLGNTSICLGSTLVHMGNTSPHLCMLKYSPRGERSHTAPGASTYIDAGHS